MTAAQRRAEAYVLAVTRWAAQPHSTAQPHEAAAPVPGAGVEPVALREAALFHRVPGLVHEAVQSAPGPLREVLAADAQAGLIRHVRTVATLSRVARALDTVAQWMVVKGPVLAHCCYERPTLRWYGDLDVLVNPGDLASVIVALEGAGCVLEDGNFALMRDERLGELHMTSPEGVQIDVHHELINRGALRDRFGVDRGAVVRRRCAADLGGTNVGIPDPVDGLLHLVVHGCLSGGDRLGWLLDVDHWWRTFRPPPDLVIERARAWGLARASRWFFARTRQTLGTDFSDALLTALAPHGASVWATAGAALQWAPTSPLARSVASTRRAWAWNVARYTATHAVLRARPHEEFVDSADNPESVMFDSSAVLGREEYLRWLSRESADTP